METPKTFNDWADYWRYTIGVNVIPADTKHKRTSIPWKQYQDAPILLEQHEQWKAEDAFREGMAIIAGKVWHSPIKKEYYLACVDLDNLRAIDEFAKNGLERLAAHVIVEQHKDDRNKAHVYFYTTKPIPKKSSDKVNPQLVQKLDRDEIPAIEVKGLGEHGISYCTPSIHKNGQPYEIIGTLEPNAVDEFKDHIDSICKKYGIRYLEAANGTNRALTPIAELFKPDYRVLEGHNRHEDILRVMESLLSRNMAILDIDSIKRFSAEWNQAHCVPPLPESEVEKQWRFATEFIARNPPAALELKPGANKTRFSQSLSTYSDAVQNEFGSNIGIKISESPTWIIAHLADKQVKDARVKAERFNEAGEPKKYVPEWGQILIDAIPTKVAETYNPLTKTTKYTLELENSRNEKTVIENMPLQEACKEIVKTSLTWKPRYINETMAAVINAYKDARLVESKTEIEEEGFFFIDEKLVSAHVELKEITKDEAVKAVDTLGQLQAVFYSRYEERQRLAHIIKFAVQAPFDYAKRQLRLENNILQRIDLAGRPDTGKTYGYARLPLLIYGKPLNDVHLVGAGSVETPARFIYKTGKTTFPIILDEVDFLVNAGKDDKVSHILSVIKNQASMTHPRDTLTKEGEVNSKPSYSAPILTHNSDVIQEEGGAKRFVGIVLTENDIKTAEEKAEFEKFISENKDNLKLIGDFAISHIMANSDILRKQWVETGKDILKALYNHASREYPNWLDAIVENTSIADVGEHRRTLIRSVLLGEINKAWASNRYGISIALSADGHTTKAPDPTLKEKLTVLMQNKLLPTMTVHQIDEVCFLSSTIDLLKKSGLDRISMPQLADLTGFEHGQVKINGKNTKVVKTTIDELTEFLA